MNEGFERNNFRELSINDPERQKEISRSGGIASGVSRSKKSKQKAIYGVLLEVACSKDFASPEELQEFRRWKKRKQNKTSKR